MTKEPVMESAEDIATKIVDRMDRDVELYHHGSETTAARKICIDRITDLLTSYANSRLDEAVNIAACTFRGVYDGENDHAKQCYLEMRKAIISLKSKEPS